MNDSNGNAFAQPPAMPVRVNSVDALRGLAALVFAVSVIAAPALSRLPQSSVLTAVRDQMRPTLGDGLSLFDGCLPGFVFVAGTSIALSYRRRLVDGHTRRRLFVHVLRRGLVLYVIGFLVKGGFTHPWPDVVLIGPLQQLAACYVISGVIALIMTRWQSLLALGAGILLVYWALSGEKQITVWVSNGLLLTVPGTAIALIGLGIGNCIVDYGTKSLKVLITLFGVGLMFINLSFVWNEFWPLNPHLWTSSFVVACAGGLSVALGCLFFLTERTGLQWLAFPLVMLGRNSLLTVLAVSVLPLGAVADVLIGGDVADFLGNLSPIVDATVQLACVFAMVFWFHRREIFVTI